MPKNVELKPKLVTISRIGLGWGFFFSKFLILRMWPIFQNISKISHFPQICGKKSLEIRVKSQGGGIPNMTRA
jgi:hypothetical protein